jgi:hypothetical protein
VDHSRTIEFLEFHEGVPQPSAASASGAITLAHGTNRDGKKKNHAEQND